MGIEFETERHIVVALLVEPSQPDRPWWWQSRTTVDGVELTLAGYARTEEDAIREAAARTIDLASHLRQATTKREPDPRYHEPGWWPTGVDSG